MTKTNYNKLTARLLSNKRGMQTSSSPRAARLRLEALETRELLDAAPIFAPYDLEPEFAPACVATLDADSAAIDLSNAVAADWLVTSAADDGASDTLRYALEHAATGATITFAASLKGQTITLNGAQLEIDKSITIDASDLYDEDANLPGITIDAAGKSRAFDTIKDVDFIGLAIVNGVADQGAGVYVSGLDNTVNFTNCTISGNAASLYGGGVCYLNPNAKGTFVNCTITNNTATEKNGGGVCFAGSKSTGTFTNCTISGNSSSIGGGVCLLNSFSNDAANSVGNFTNCTITENDALSGGGVYISGTGTFSDCVINDNTTKLTGKYTYGAGVYILGTGEFTNCSIQNNSAKNNTNGYGGGIYLSGKGFFSECTIANNICHTTGGGLWLYGTYVFTKCNINSNESYGGCGGFYLEGDCTVTDSIIGNNISHNGGGGAYIIGTGKFVTCSIINNVASSYGGGVYIWGDVFLTNSLVANNRASEGGGVYFYITSFYPTKVSNGTFTNCTITQNKSSKGGGLYVTAGRVNGEYATVTLHNSIISLNRDNNGEISEFFMSSSDSYILNAYNTLSTYRTWSNGNDPSLGNYVYDAQKPLFNDAENGDYTLAVKSQAIDKGKNSYIALETDLAGRKRVIYGTVDMGAYEFIDPNTPFKRLDTPTLTTTSTGNAITASWKPIANATGYEVVCGSVKRTIAAGATQFKFTGLKSGTPYVVRVKALGNGEEFLDSEYATTTATTVSLPPLAPPTAQLAPVGASDKMPITWTSVDDAVGYTIAYRDVADVEFTTTTVGNVTSYELRGLDKNVTYEVKVSAVADGIESADSDYGDPLFFSLQLPAPTLTASATMRTITVSWEPVENAVLYKVVADGVEQTLDAETTSFTLANLEATTSHTFAVRACSSRFIDSQPATITVSTKSTTLDKPVVTANPSANTIELNWEPVEDATSYTVSYKVSSAASFKNVTVNSGTSYTIPRLVANTTYTIRVVANGEEGRKSQATQLSVKTLAQSQPLAVPELTIDQTTNAIAITWLPVPNATGYALTCAETTQIVDAQTTTFTFANLTPATRYSISVKALGDGTKYLDSAPATAIVKTLDELGVQEGQAFTLTVDVASDATVYWNFGDGVWRESGAVCVVDPTEYAFPPGRSTLRCRTTSDAEPFYSVGIDVSEATPSINFEPVAIGNEQTAVYRIETNFAGRVAARDWRVDWGDGTSTVYSNQYSFVIGHVYATPTPESKRNIAIALLDASGSETYSATLVGASENAEIANAILDGAATVPTRLIPFVRDAFDQDWRNDELGGKSLPIDEILPEIESAKFTVRRVAFSEVDDWTAEETLDVDLGAF